mmetsp:Transcript_3550/g.8089  ORF Transcript_3550/g.8089 Transcript_3550/m.8089 type:complete len:276 (+) Transcript_3550:97-924(+)
MVTTKTDSDLKVSYAIQVVSICTLVALLAGHVTTNFQLAVGMLATFHLWGLIWIKILWSSPNIYSVRVMTMTLNDWIPLSLPSNDSIKIRKDRVVTSISELSGIRGTHMMVALRVMTSTLNVLTLVAIQNDLHHRGTHLLNIRSQKDMVPICLLIMCTGMFLTGHFELNLMDTTHSMGHYIGLLGIFVGSLCIGFAFHWNFVSLLLIGSQFGLCFYWFVYSTKVVKSPDLKLVTRQSKVCIGIELAMFYITNSILVITVYASGKNEGKFFVSPFL